MPNNDQENNGVIAHLKSQPYVDLDARNYDVVEETVLRKKDLERPVVQEFISVSKHLDDDYVEMLLVEARHRARIPVFVEKLQSPPNPPALYAQSPRNLKLPDFIRKEWIDKGFNPSEIDRQMLDAYDPKIVRAIENYEYNNGLLDKDLRFTKTGNRRSRKEMSVSHA